MNSLHNKIEEAANLFQNHDFKKSLQLYDQCINICKRNQQPKSLLHNLISTKGALMSILGDQKGALQCLNQVLDEDPYHTLCLMRRSQVFKKKNQLHKALKDLKSIGNFSPDNLQIAAMKVQIQNLKLKNKQPNSSSESESQNSSQSDDIDEEEKLNFANLRKIDRKSVSIMMKPQSRKSRVTIAGDIAIEYDAVEDDTKDNSSFASTNVSKQYAKEKYIKTFRQIELDDEQSTKDISKKSIQTPIIKVKSTAQRTKSILKNRDSVLYVNNDKPIEKQKKYGGRQSKMIDLLKNIDGKVISSHDSERKSMSVKQVEFRKSVFGAEQDIKALTQGFSQNQVSNPKGKAVRKSCLKRSSFDLKQEETKSSSAQPRRSKFDSMSMKGIDGIVIRNHKNSLEKDQVKSRSQLTDSDSDEGSQHNIFGKNKIYISKEVRETLGLGEDSGSVKKQAKPRTTGGKSILKKCSVLIKNVQKSKQPSPQKAVNKPKKSVMFTKFQ